MSRWRLFSVKDDSGTVAVLFAFLLVPMALTIGLALDYTRTTAIKNKLQQAADASALAMAAAYQSGADVEAIGRNFFEANVGADSIALVQSISFKVTPGATAGMSNAQVTFTANVPAMFGQLFGSDTLPAIGSSVAALNTKPALDLYVLVDTSDSMGLAADDVSEVQLKSLTTTAYSAGQVTSAASNCSFACHKNQGSAVTTLSIARANNVHLRIDVAREGIGSLLDLSEGTDTRVSLSAFNSDLYSILPLEADLAKVRFYLQGLEVGYNKTSTEDANSWFDRIASPFADDVKSQVDAALAQAKSKSAMPKQVVLLVTDGLNSQNCAACSGRQYVFPFRTSDCELIKATGAELAVMYAKYREMPTDSTYLNHADHAVPLIEADLKECASPGLFAMGDSPAEIKSAFQTLFTKISANVRLTN